MFHFPVTILLSVIGSFCFANAANASLTDILSNVCTNLKAKADISEIINAPIVDERGMTATIALRPATHDWRIAVVTINDAQARPHAEIRLNKKCVVMQSRQLIWDENGNSTAIHDLGPDLETIIQKTMMNPEQKFTAKPNDAMPGNPRIALVDTGVNYTLPVFWPNIAVDKSGRLIGYDFWDDDPWPYDSDTTPLH